MTHSSKKTGARKKNNKNIPVKAGAGLNKKTNNTQPAFYIVCIGASAGGLNAVTELMGQLPASVNAAFFVVLHLSKASVGEILESRLKTNTSLSCSIARHHESIEVGRIYIAPPDTHLLVKNDRVILGKGPHENRFRPSIDVLFRSAAANYTERTIGIVLTGFLNDGTAGMWAIRQCGGHCIVQDPNEAEYPDMPLSVLDTMKVDYAISVQEMTRAIVTIISASTIKGVKPPKNIVTESALAERAATNIEELSEIGDKSGFACPDCGGGLWKVKNGRLEHYRCHEGHSYSEKDLIVKQAEHIEHTIWVALRMMEERKSLLARISRQNMEKGLAKLSNTPQEQADSLEHHIEKLKELLYAIHKN